MRSTGRLLFSGLLIFAVSMVLAGTASAQGSGFHLVNKVKLGGDGGWDYLTADPVNHNVFISRSTHIMVVDATGKLVGDIPDLKGTHGPAVVPAVNKGFSSNGGSNSVTAFDLKTFAKISDIVMPDAMGPDGFLYDPATKRVFTFNARSNNATAVDTTTLMAVPGSAPLGGKPEAATADGKGHIFSNVEDKSQVVEFDSKTLQVMNTWPLAPCMEPSGMAIDPAHDRIFIGCHNNIMAIMDTTNGKVITTVPIGTGIDADGFDPGLGFAYASCGDGTITVVHEDSPEKFTVVDTIHTQAGARTMAFDTGNHNLYTVTAEMGPAPAATADNPRPRATPVPGSFTLLIYGR